MDQQQIREEISRKESLLARTDLIQRLPDKGEKIRVALARLRDDLAVIVPTNKDCARDSTEEEEESVPSLPPEKVSQFAAERQYHLEHYGNRPVDAKAVLSSSPSWVLLSEESRRAKLAQPTAIVLTGKETLLEAALAQKRAEEDSEAEMLSWNWGERKNI